jgi:hypothetical protein
VTVTMALVGTEADSLLENIPEHYGSLRGEIELTVQGDLLHLDVTEIGPVLDAIDAERHGELFRMMRLARVVVDYGIPVHIERDLTWSFMPDVTAQELIEAGFTIQLPNGQPARFNL